jgi:Uma2 family endonuclease
MSVARESVFEERELYPVHEEDNVPVRPAHEYQVGLLQTTLRCRLPKRWVTGDICMYWEEGAFQRYVAPDVLVLEAPIEGEDPGVFLKWKDPQALLAIEVGSKSTFRHDEGPKIERYLGDLEVREYLYFKPHRLRRWRTLGMWRLEGEEPVEVRVNEAGRLPSVSLGLEFGLDGDTRLRVFEPDGRMLPLPEEIYALAREVTAQLDEERQRAEQERLRLEQEVQRLRAELAARTGE